MSAQTLNIIYDTNYTTIVNDWGFVENNFSKSKWKKPWFFDLLFGNPNKLVGNNKENSGEKKETVKDKPAEVNQAQTPAQDQQ